MNPTNKNNPLLPQPLPMLQASPCSCPHWEQESGTCQLVQNGLFIPVQEHVESYCRTTHFRSCTYYEQLAGVGHPVFQETDNPTNRRRSIRIPSRQCFRFSEITGSDQLPGVRENDAWTVDLSEHGIRFASRHLLRPETFIRFLLESDETGEKTAGIGRIIWAEPLEHTPLFHAGIVFVDQSALSPPRA